MFTVCISLHPCSTQSKLWRIELLYRYKRAKTRRITVLNIRKLYLYFVYFKQMKENVHLFPSYLLFLNFWLFALDFPQYFEAEYFYFTNVSYRCLDLSTISLQDFTEALRSFKPASLHGIKLHQGVDLGWKDIGGLEKIKRILMETLEWPAKVRSVRIA